MTALALPVVQHTAEWLAERRNHVTSSDAVVLAGERGSVVQLWAQKTLGVEPQFDDETQDLMDVGSALEPVLLRLYTARTDRPVQKVNRLLVNRDWPIAGASLDGRSGRRVVEAKFSHSIEWFASQRAESPDPVPAKVMAQIQWMLYVTGWDVADVAILLGREFKVIEVGRDDGYIDNLVYVARWFWPYVERGEQPPTDGLDATTRALRDLYPQDNGGWLPQTPELAELVGRYATAKAIAKDTEVESIALGNEIRALLGDWSGITGLVSNKANAASQVVEWEPIAHEYRALLDAYEHGRATPDPDEWDVIQSRNTHMKPGPRVLRLLKGAKAS